MTVRRAPMACLVAAGLVATVSACAGGGRCSKPQPYESVRPRPPLQVPPDLSEPRGAVAPITEETGSTARTVDGRCLEEPPEYVPTPAEQGADAETEAEPAKKTRKQRRAERQREKAEKRAQKQAEKEGSGDTGGN